MVAIMLHLSELNCRRSSWGQAAAAAETALGLQAKWAQGASSLYTAHASAAEVQHQCSSFNQR